MKLLENKKQEVTEVIAHDVAPLTVNINARAYSRLGWIIVLVGVLGFLVWAAFAPLDKGVPLSGNVAKEGNRKAVQHLTGGTVQEILVKEGDQVKKGQILVRMNSVLVNSQSEITKTQLFAARATEARLLAERDDKSSVAFPAELKEYKQDARVQENVSLQTQLFISRQAALHNELAAVDESIAGLKAQLAGLQASQQSKKDQLVFLKEQLDNLRDLSRDGYVARSKLLDLERSYVQITGSISEDGGNIGRTQRQIAELMLKRTQRQADYKKEVGTLLADTRRDADALSSRLTSEVYSVTNSDVKAPVDGVVIGLAVFTKGGVVQPGFRMMDIVPVDDALIVEGRMAVNLVDKVHAGLPVELVFSAFNSNTTPHISGEVTTVSPDRLMDEHNGQPYYTVLAKVTPAGLKQLKEKKLDVRPGMPVEMFVKTGERTMMSYLLKPVFDRAKTSLTEE